MVQVEELDLSDMRFLYPHEYSEYRRLLYPIVSRCLQINCDGLPPLTCSAFRSADGTVYKPRTGANGECVRCESIIGPIILIGVSFVFGVIALILYVWAINRSPQPQQLSKTHHPLPTEPEPKVLLPPTCS